MIHMKNETNVPDMLQLTKVYFDEVILGGIHLVRTQPGGRGGFQIAYGWVQGGRGGLGHEYVRKINCLPWTFAKKIGIVESIFVTF